MNKEKTEGMWMGSLRNINRQILGVKWVNMLRLLGIYLSYDTKQSDESNRQSKLKDMKNKINSWNRRGLTIIGKINIMKTFLISKFQYYLSICSPDDSFIQQLNKEIFTFLWGSKREKLKRDRVVKEMEKGGLGVPHLKAIILTSRIKWLKRFIYQEDSIWKHFWQYNMNKVCKNFLVLVQANFDLK